MCQGLNSDHQAWQQAPLAAEPPLCLLPSPFRFSLLNMSKTLGKRLLSPSVERISYKHPLSINKLMANELRQELEGEASSRDRAKCGRMGPDIEEDSVCN